MTLNGLALTAATLVASLSSCYVTSQAWSQAKLLSKRRPVSDVLQDGDVDAKTKDKLRFSQTALQFAQSQGLVVDDSYSKFVLLDGPAVSYLVQAARPDEFKLKTWWFPVVGTVPYLGFFDVSDRDHYAKELEAEGFEVHRGSAAAFSSLGWFSDPIYSSMLGDEESDLAHLFFHELTHKTAWINESAEFNENFAEFIGEAMTERFLKSMGQNQDLRRWLLRRRDRELFKAWLKDLREELERYFVDSTEKKVQDLVRGKKSIIAAYVANAPKFEELNYIGQREWNTPRILGASLYSPDTSKFQQAFVCSGFEKLGDFVRAVKKRLEASDNSDKGLASFCSPSESPLPGH